MNDYIIREIEEDIKKLEDHIEKNNINKIDLEDVIELYVYKYQDDIKSIITGLSLYNSFDGNRYNDLKKIKAKLEFYLVKLRDGKKIKNVDTTPNISIINDNKSNAKNQVSINISFEEITKDIKNNSSISEDSRKDILERINELKDLSESDDTRVQKWRKAKTFMNWISTQGVDIGIKVLPLLIKAFSE